MVLARVIMLACVMVLTRVIMLACVMVLARVILLPVMGRDVGHTSQVPQPTCFWTSQSQAGTLSRLTHIISCFRQWETCD